MLYICQLFLEDMRTPDLYKTWHRVHISIGCFYMSIPLRVVFVVLRVAVDSIDYGNDAFLNHNEHRQARPILPVMCSWKYTQILVIVSSKNWPNSVTTIYHCLLLIPLARKRRLCGYNSVGSHTTQWNDPWLSGETRRNCLENSWEYWHRGGIVDKPRVLSFVWRFR